MSNDKRTRILSNPSADGNEKAATRVLNDAQPASSPVAQQDSAPKTRVISSAQTSTDEIVEAHAFEPVVGWLVVKTGPGRGRSVQIYYGMNSVGRDAGERISLNFGDTSISRESHAYIVYDDKQKDFYVQHGGKSNLVRVNDKPVLAPTELNAGDLIEIGGTILLFVPLCGDTFNWDKD